MTRSAQWAHTHPQTTTLVTHVTPDTQATKGRSVLIRASVALATASVFLVSCAAPTVFSGGNLPPEQQSTLRVGSGVKIHQIDSTQTDARVLIMAPGTYAVQISSKRDLKTVNSALAGIVKEAECKFPVDLQPGEEVQVYSKMQSTKGSFRGGYDMSQSYIEISLRSSVEGRTRLVDIATHCKTRVDCSRADRRQVTPVGCDD